MRGEVALLLLAAPLVACHGANLSPKQMDDVHASCQAQLQSHPGMRPPTAAGDVVQRTPANPPGTPVVVYGASWCAACGAAVRYMERWHIPVVEKDVERDPAAKAGLVAATLGFGPRANDVLPVIDVRGTVMLGFNPCLVEWAWAAP